MNQPTKILSPEKLRLADAYTIKHEHITSIELMEKAASRCLEWIINNIKQHHPFHVFCGLGNNGGDGLAISRLLKQKGYKVTVYIIRYSKIFSEDFLHNEQRLKRIYGEDVYDITAPTEFPEIRSGEIIIDALFGIGLSKPVEGLAKECVEHINQSKEKVIAIDMPSGLFAEQHTLASSAVVNANFTLSFQCPKLAFMFAENALHIGEWVILDIGLSEQFIEELECTTSILTETFIYSMLKLRGKFSHKGNFGHALLIAGKYATMGAAILSAKACLRSGVGMLTVHVPIRGVAIMQISAPEAIISVDKHYEIFTESPNALVYTAIGLGPGLGTEQSTKKALYEVLQQRQKAMVMDADALNIISLNKTYNQHLPPHCILTPHFKEFERLTRKVENDFERFHLQLEFSKSHKVYILLKSAHSCLTTPEGLSFFNSTGNPGMAKGGSGDVLTGIITGLLAQGYSSLDAGLIGMYIHGLAGDFACERLGASGMTAGDIIDFLPKAWMHLESI